MKKRLDDIDRTKGILIILVVIGHIWQAGAVHNFIYNFHMPAFFVISGMMFAYTRPYEKKFIPFLLSRLYSIGIPFVFIECLGCLTDIVRNGITQNMKGYIYNTLTLNFNDANLWFLFTLFWLEVLFAVLKKVLKKDGVLFAAGCIFLVVRSAVPSLNSPLSMLHGILYYSFFFAAGNCFFRLFKEKKPVWICALWVPVLLISAFFGKQTDSALSVKNLLFVISALLGTLGVLQLGQLNPPDKIRRALELAGKNSLLVYGTHHIIYAVVGVLLGVTDYKTTPLWAGLVMLAAVALLEIPVVFLINRYLPFLAGKHFWRKEAKV